MIAIGESITVIVGGLLLVGIGLLIIMRQPWLVGLTSRPRRQRPRFRRRPRPRFRRAA